MRFVAQQGEVVDNARLSEWIDSVFPEGRTVHQRLLEIASRPIPGKAPNQTARPMRRPAVSRPMPPPSKGRQWYRGLILAPIAAVILGLALLACFGRRSIPLDRPLKAPGPVTYATGRDSRQSVVLELALTLEGGERHTLLRIQPEPQGTLRVDGPATAPATDAVETVVAPR
jgi:hypothetical protein